MSNNNPNVCFKVSRYALPFAVISISLLSLNGCFLVAAGAGAEAAYVATQEDRTTGEVLTDQRITSSIKTRLLADQSVPGLDINVDTHKSNVILRGVLKSQSQVDRALEIARSTDGVLSVESQLFVR